MRIIAKIGFLIGLAVIIGLVLWQGAAPVGAALLTLGVGVLLLLPVYAVYLAMGVYSWRLLFLPGREPAFWPTMLAIWIGSSVNTLLPVATLGGEAVKARILTRFGRDAAEAGGSVVGDTTVQALSLALWGAIGTALLAAVATDADALYAALGASLLFALGVGAFVWLQRRGLFASLALRLRRFDRGDRPALRRFAGQMVNFDKHVREIYDRPGRVVGATAIRLASRILLTTEIWIAAWLMGHPIGIFDAILIRSLAAAVRGAAFLIPNGLGVQEGAYMAFGLVIGLPPGFSLSLSLAVRAREIISSVPGLVAWQAVEGRGFFSRNRDSS